MKQIDVIKEEIDEENLLEETNKELQQSNSDDSE